MAILGSTPIAGFVAPSAEVDTYPSHKAKYGHGGHRSVSTLAERDNISPARKEIGMTVYVVAEDATYILKPGGWELSSSNSSSTSGIAVKYATLADMSADVTQGSGTQAFNEETNTIYKWNITVPAWEPYIVFDYYEKPIVDAMMAGAAVGLTFSLRDIPGGSNAATQMNALTGVTEGKLAILNDDAIYRYTKTSVDPAPETFEWQSFAVLSAGHTHDYIALNNKPDLKYEVIKELYDITAVMDESVVPVTKGLYYSEVERTFWESDGTTKKVRTDFVLQDELPAIGAGDAAKYLRVKDTEDGVEFAEAPWNTFTETYKKLVPVAFTVAQESDMGVIAGMVAGDKVHAVAEDTFWEYDGSIWSLIGNYEIAVPKKVEDLDVDTDGIVGGMILKWDDVNAVWKAGFNDAADTFSNINPTPFTVGGIPAGSTFTDVPLVEMWDKLLYPYQVPVASVSVFGIPTQVELGGTISSGSYNMLWTITNSGNVAPFSLYIEDDNTGSILATGLDDDGMESINIPNIYNSTPSVYTWKLIGNDTNGETFEGSYTVRWSHKWYYGESVDGSLNGAGVQALRVNEFINNKPTGTKTMAAGGYKYFAVPTDIAQPTSFKDAATNLDVDMNPMSLVNVTNGNGVTVQYKVYRTKNVLNGAINIIIN